MNSGKERFLTDCKDYFIEHNLIERFLTDYSLYPDTHTSNTCEMGPIVSSIDYGACPSGNNWRLHSIKMRGLYNLEPSDPSFVPTIQEFIDYITIPQSHVCTELW